MTLVCQLNILLRGGISIGKISMEPDTPKTDDILFGPALVRSYDLENKEAIYPRIVIDSPVITQAEQHQGSLWPEFVRKDKDEDGNFFLDYLFAAVTDSLLFAGEKQLNPMETLQAHKASTERKIKSLEEKDANIIKKLRWLVSYHNGVIQRLRALRSKGPDPFDVFDNQPPEISDSMFISDELLN